VCRCTYKPWKSDCVWLFSTAYYTYMYMYCTWDMISTTPLTPLPSVLHPLLDLPPLTLHQVGFLSTLYSPHPPSQATASTSPLRTGSTRHKQRFTVHFHWPAVILEVWPRLQWQLSLGPTSEQVHLSFYGELFAKSLKVCPTLKCTFLCICFHCPSIYVVCCVLYVLSTFIPFVSLVGFTFSRSWVLTVYMCR
jgi:hypothetical protein